MKRTLASLTTLLSLLTPLAAQQLPWQSLYGPPEPTIRAMGAGPDGTVYCGTEYGSMFRRSAGADRWERIDSTIVGHTINGIVIDAAHNRVYITSDHPPVAQLATYVTTDDGTTWSRVEDSTLMKIAAITQNDRTGSEYLLTSDRRLYRSTDDGGTWDSVTVEFDSTPLTIGFIGLVYDRMHQALLTATPAAVYRSTDDGVTWDTVTSDPTNSIRQLFCSSDGVLYRAHSLSTTFRSGDAGTTWTEIGNTLPTGFASIVAVDSASRAIEFDFRWFALYAYDSTTGDWIKLPFEPEAVGLVEVAADGAIAVKTASRVVRIDPDDSTVAPFDQGLRSNRVTKLTMGPGRSAATIDANGTAMRIPNADTVAPVWNSLGGQPLTAVLLASDSSIWVGRSTGGGLFSSTDGGVTWVPRGDSLSNQTIYSIVEVGDGRVIVVNFDGVYRSSTPVIGSRDTEAISWRRVDATAGTRFIRRASDGSLLGALADGASTNSPWRMFNSTDGGVGWRPVGSGEFTATINDADVTATGDVVAATSDGIVYWRRTTPFTWEQVQVAAPDTVAASVDALSDSTILVATSRGVVRSTDAGATWQTANDGLNLDRAAGILSIRHNRYGDVLVATTADGVFRAAGPVNRVNTIANTRSALEVEVEPNPSSDHTVVRLTNSRPIEATIVIRDLLGRLRATAFVGSIAAGTHQLPIDVGALPSGNYLVSILTAEGTASRVMRIVR